MLLIGFEKGKQVFALSLKIEIVSQEKSRWTEGIIALIDQDGSLLGGDTLIDGLDELVSAREQFKKAPAVEISACVDGGKKSRFALFLSSKQIKYYSDSDKLRIMAGKAIRTAGKLKCDRVLMPLENASIDQIETIIQGAQIAAYSFNKYKSTITDPKACALTLAVDKSLLKEVQSLVRNQETIDGGVTLARNLVNEIPSELYPERLASLAKQATTEAGLKVTIYDAKRLAKENFNGVLTVGRGSKHPPTLMVFKHTPAKKTKIHLCLVGKAVTFDTGGHSLKPAKAMWEMKGDMAGGAAVIGAIQAIGRLKPNIEVTGIVPSALNAIGPDAMLPGDIIRSRSGKTVHVDNTDAEGRLILMDALNLAQELGATHIIDVATLTGSIVRALGEAMSGLFSNDDEWANAIIGSGADVGEGFWRMPLIQEYREQLDHPLADLDNVGKGVNAGSITAALFLQEFVPENVKWAHLDIAACGLITKSYKHFGPGGTGFGVRTMVELAIRLADKNRA